MIPLNLVPTGIRRTENAVSNYFAELPRGVTLEHLADPDLWMHVARKFAVNDTITVVVADGSIDCDLRVIEIDPGFHWVRTRVLRMYHDADAARAAPEGPDKNGDRIEFGGAHKWRIVDRAGNIVAKGIPTRLDAEEALASIRAAKAPSQQQDAA